MKKKRKRNSLQKDILDIGKAGISLSTLSKAVEESGGKGIGGLTTMSGMMPTAGSLAMTKHIIRGVRNLDKVKRKKRR